LKPRPQDLAPLVYLLSSRSKPQLKEKVDDYVFEVCVYFKVNLETLVLVTSGTLVLVNSGTIVQVNSGTLVTALTAVIQGS